VRMEEFDVLSWTLQQQPITYDCWRGHQGELQLWDHGVLVWQPDQPAGKDIVLSCGIHGNETAPIEIVRDIIHDLIHEGQTPVHRVLFLFGNPWAIAAGVRELEYNMNRLFSGAHQQGPSREQQRAAQLEQYVTRFYQNAPVGERERLHYDLHTAIRDSYYEKFAIYPFQHGKPYSKQQLSFLAACGITTILLNQAPTTTFSYYSVRQHQAQGFTVELGKVRPFGQNDRSRFADTEQMLRQLLRQSNLQLPSFEPQQHHIFAVTRVIDRTQQDFRLHFAEDVANFTEFPVGYRLASDGDKEHFIDAKGQRIIFPNAKVAIGQRALLLVQEQPIEALALV